MAAPIGLALPFAWLVHRRSSRFKKFEEQFPEALDLLSRAIRAGHAFQTAMGMVGEELNEPVGPEFKKTFERQNFGLPLRDAMDELADRVTLLDVRFFVTAVAIQRETGGNLAEILDNLAHVVRERFKIRRQVRVHTAHGRFTGYVLLALPAALGAALSYHQPRAHEAAFQRAHGSDHARSPRWSCRRSDSSGSGRSSRSRCSAMTILLPLLAFLFASLLVTAGSDGAVARRGGGDRAAPWRDSRRAGR